MRKLRLIIMPFVFGLYKVIFWFFKLLPVQDKVVATTMRGRKYADNPRYIIEKLHELKPELDIVWFVDNRYKYDVPSWIRAVPYYRFGMLRRIYEMATARVWINSHLWEIFVQKKKNQLFIQTWHGSIPIKKINMDMSGWNPKTMSAHELSKTVSMTDVFISNSDFTDEMYRRSFGYKGPIYKCGSPRNDELVNPIMDYKGLVRNHLGLKDEQILLYAPTFRDDFEKTHVVDYSCFNIDFNCLYQALKKKFGGEWVILVKFHPIMQIFIDEKRFFQFEFVKNATSYTNVQALLVASDIVLTDYSSLIFDSAEASKPGFTICLDYEKYKEQRDFYFDIKKLPFPFAATNAELISNIEKFDKKKYNQSWAVFAAHLGIKESGHSSEDIALKVIKYLSGEPVTWNECK